MDDIMEFQGVNRWLSNFWPTLVRLDGEVYPSVENAYQAAKTYPQNRGGFVGCTPGQAKRLGKTVVIRPDWDAEKVSVMRSLIAQKFALGSELGGRLLNTGDAQIVEGNTWGDTFWGVCRGKGRNILGELIMDRRKELQE